MFGTDTSVSQIRIIDPSQYHVENIWYFHSEGLVVATEERCSEKEAHN